jgi:hypothetical protein
MCDYPRSNKHKAVDASLEFTGRHQSSNVSVKVENDELRRAEYQLRQATSLSTLEHVLYLPRKLSRALGAVRN